MAPRTYGSEPTTVGVLAKQVLLSIPIFKTKTVENRTVLEDIYVE